MTGSWSRTDGSRVEVIDAGDGTGTHTYYDRDGKPERVEQVKGLPTEPPTEKVRRSLDERLHDALAANKTYLALTQPTAAQQRQQVDRLTRQVQALIRLGLNQLDADD